MVIKGERLFIIYTQNMKNIMCFKLLACWNRRGGRREGKRNTNDKLTLKIANENYK